MPVNKTPARPTRKTLITGQSLPELETTFRPLPLGFDRQGDASGAIRAFAVSIRNRADSPVYVKEGDESDPVKIDRFESFNIWETNGVKSVSMRGENGGEEVELRLLVAHNDFSVTDKIDAFVRAINHFLTQNKQETVVTGQEVTFDVAGNVTVDDIVTGSIDISSVNDTVTIDDITAGNVVIDDITNTSATFDVTGAVDVGTINTVADTITIDDITATNASFDGDITGQTNFDLSNASREGQSDIEAYDVSNASVGYYNSSLNAIVAEFQHVEVRSNAAYDGQLQRVEFRVKDTAAPSNIGFQVAIDYDTTGSWDVVSPRATMRGEFARRFSGPSVTTPRFYPYGDVVIVWEPRQPVAFEAGDSIGVEMGPHGTTAGEGSADYELEVQVADIVTR